MENSTYKAPPRDVAVLPINVRSLAVIVESLHEAAPPAMAEFLLNIELDN